MVEFPESEQRFAVADDCRRCPALVESRTCIAWGNGPTDASLVVVGEAPAAGDPDADRWQGGNRTGMAYTSRRSGRKIRTLVADLGFRDDAYYTNAVKCFPADPDDRSNNREPTRGERANCRPYLVEEIRSVDPDAVLATGKHATKSVLAAADPDRDWMALDGGFLGTVLDPVDCPTLSTTLVPLVHPSYQEVWIPRLGFAGRDEYVSSIRTALETV